MYNRSNLKEEETTIDCFCFSTIYTPGHSSDSICFYFKESDDVFVGDFIFKESMGRTDFPGGSDTDMQESINKILNYPTDTILYPGHYDNTTLEYEKKNNPFLK